jgi:1-acyl-sn-glycerol-3-phosphate acyltransferase
MVSVLRDGGRIIVFPEGGRTCYQQERLVSRGGKRLGRLTKSVALLVKKADLVLPVWVDGAETVLPNGKFPFPHFWQGRVVVKIGEPFKMEGEAAEETKRLESVLLGLADEE